MNVSCKNSYRFGSTSALKRHIARLSGRPDRLRFSHRRIPLVRSRPRLPASSLKECYMIARRRSTAVVKARLRRSSSRAASLLDAYRQSIEVWKLQNDIYFRRVQILMTAIQAALLVAAITVLTKLPVGSLEYCLVFALATLGCLTSFAWGSMIRRTRSFLELSDGPSATLRPNLASTASHCSTSL